MVHLSLNTHAQVKAAPLLEVGMIAGGQATSTKFYFKNAYSAAMGVSFTGEKSIIRLSATAGLDRFNDEVLFPMSLTLAAYRSAEKMGGHFLVSGGYSVAQNDNMKEVAGLDYRGGANMAVGYGYARKLGSRQWFYSSLRLRQQFMHTEWEVSGKPSVDKRFNYMLLQFVVGFQI